MLGRQNVGVEGLKYVEFGVTRINRYIVECKSATVALNILSILELIDTQWNVNRDIWKEQCKTKLGINRYIVECKYAFLADVKTDAGGN